MSSQDAVVVTPIYVDSDDLSSTLDSEVWLPGEEPMFLDSSGLELSIGDLEIATPITYNVESDDFSW